MSAAHYIAGAVLCTAVIGCGNKGDLFLDPTRLSDEQKALLGQLDGDSPPAEQGIQPDSAEDKPNTEVSEEDAESEAEKKKNARDQSGASTTQQ